MDDACDAVDIAGVCVVFYRVAVAVAIVAAVVDVQLDSSRLLA